MGGRQCAGVTRAGRERFREWPRRWRNGRCGSGLARCVQPAVFHQVKLVMRMVWYKMGDVDKVVRQYRSHRESERGDRAYYRVGFP